MVLVLDKPLAAHLTLPIKLILFELESENDNLSNTSITSGVPGENILEDSI